jgi:tetratricopeptide (TPR) repeat protein
MSAKRLENDFGTFTDDFKGVKYFNHSGGTNGFLCLYVGSYVDGNGIVIMVNTNSMKLIEEILCSIASLNNWKNFPLEPRKESINFAIKKASYKNINKGIKLYQKLKKDKSAVYNFSEESELNSLGYEFMNENLIESAIKIFNLNVNEFPNSPNVYDSRGEAYFNKKNYLLSKKDYLKVVELDATNQNAKDMLLKIEAILKK